MRVLVYPQLSPDTEVCECGDAIAPGVLYRAAVIAGAGEQCEHARNLCDDCYSLMCAECGIPEGVEESDLEGNL